jgi:flagellar biogenesis protein FliO
MDILSMLRTLGALGMVLGMLAGALWMVKRYDIKLPGRVSTTGRKRVELVERLSLDQKRSVALIRRDGHEHLVLIGPEGSATLETGIIAPPAEPVPEPVKIAMPELPAIAANFAKLIKLPKVAEEEIAPDVALDTEQDNVVVEAPAAELAEVVDLSERRKAKAEAAAPAAKRTRRPRDTARWNRRAVREALNA